MPTIASSLAHGQVWSCSVCGIWLRRFLSFDCCTFISSKPARCFNCKLNSSWLIWIRPTLLLDTDSLLVTRWAELVQQARGCASLSPLTIYTWLMHALSITLEQAVQAMSSATGRHNRFARVLPHFAAFGFTSGALVVRPQWIVNSASSHRICVYSVLVMRRGSSCMWHD